MIAVFFLSLVLGALGTSSVSAADFVVVNATNVNVRTQPSTSSKSLGKAAFGTILQRTEERADGWSAVVYGTKNAFVKTEFLAPYGVDLTSLTTSAAAAVGGTAVSNAAVADTSTKSAASASTSYIANKNTHKFHYPSCSSVSKMSEKNKWYFTGSRDELISKGYVPCKNCNP